MIYLILAGLWFVGVIAIFYKMDLGGFQPNLLWGIVVGGSLFLWTLFFIILGTGIFIGGISQ